MFVLIAKTYFDYSRKLYEIYYLRKNVSVAKNRNNTNMSDSEASRIKSLLLQLKKINIVQY